MSNTPPPTFATPIDGTLALSITARRKLLQARRHLLPSAPLLGRPTRRLVVLRAREGSAATLRWRTQRGWREMPATAHPAVSTAGRRTGSGDSRSAAPSEWRASGAPIAFVPGTDSVVLEGTTAIDEKVPARANTDLRSERRSTERGSPVDAPREFTVAPTLVWWERWREVRLARTVEERRASPGVAHGAVRPAATGLRQPTQVERAASKRPTLPDASAPRPRVVSDSWALPMRASPRDWRTLAEVVRPTRGREPVEARASGTLTRAAVFPAQGSAGGDGLVSDPIALGGPVTLVPSPGPAAKAAAHALAAVRKSLPLDVAAQVQKDVARAIERAESARPSPAPKPPAAPRIDDRTANALLDRIRGLMREERFRHGELR